VGGEVRVGGGVGGWVGGGGGVGGGSGGGGVGGSLGEVCGGWVVRLSRPPSSSSLDLLNRAFNTLRHHKPHRRRERSTREDLQRADSRASAVDERAGGQHPTSST